MTSIPTDLSPSERSDDAVSKVVAIEKPGGWPISNGLIVGALAGLVASGLMLWIGRSWGGSIVAQLMAERTTAELPLSVVRDSIQNLEENAKPVALIGITIGQVIAAALGAVVYGRFAGSTPRQRILGGLALSGVAWLVLSVVAAPIGGIGLFALDSPLGVGKTHLNFILTSIAYGVMVAAMVPWPQGSAAQTDDGRRNIMKLAGLGALAIPAIWATRYIGVHANRLRTSADTEAAFRSSAGSGTFEAAGMPEFYTPLDAFYVVSKNLVDPSVAEMDWSLKIGGLVDNPMTLSFSDVLLRDSREMASTLECISNRVGGSYISNGIWTGFPLKELLQEAGLQDGVVDIKMEAADGYTESIPVAKALQDDTMLMYLIDGQPLPEKHGFPVRLIVPNIFGMKNVKWITSIEAVNEDYQGYWEERQWSDVATVVTMSRIDIPSRGFKANLGDNVEIGGVSFAGNRGISMVEVSTDGGATWQEAELSEVPSNRTWRLWRYDHSATEPGIQRVVVRATDGNGDMQPETEQDPLPDGATGLDRDWFEVLDANGKSADIGGESISAASRKWLDGNYSPEAATDRQD
jgi:DMSO/TMAO reductase YedYZ molybdopterin-dependent catalytic subunit